MATDAMSVMWRVINEGTTIWRDIIHENGEHHKRIVKSALLTDAMRQGVF